MSILTGTGIIIEAYNVNWNGGASLSPYAYLYDGDLALKSEGYSHTILAEGGYDTASIPFVESIFRANDWYRDGLGRAIVVKNEVGGEKWMGVVNRIVFTQGNLTSEIGPLMDISNDVMAVYTPLYVDTSPVMRGATRFTTIVQDSTSIAKYGNHMLVLNAGEAVIDGGFNEAEQARDTFLSENAYPNDDGQSISFSSGNVSIALECVGLRYYLQKYIYNNLTVGTTTISGTVNSKLEQVLAADPNHVLTNFRISANPVLTRDYEDQNRSAQTIISEMLGLGGSSFERWTFGVYADRTAIYKPAPTHPEYTLRIGEESRILRHGTDTVVMPWELLPAKWLFAQNAYEGEPVTSQTVNPDDRRFMFIESVTYTAPDDFQINGARVGRLAQMIAQMGLKGIK